MESLPEHHFTTLSETLGRLSDSPILPGAVAALKHDSKLINAQLGEAVIAQIPAFCATTK